MSKFKPILISLLLVIPLNIYIIGDFLGNGIQWALIRYQQTMFGQTIIVIYRDFLYMLYGTLGFRTSLSLFLWSVGTVILLGSLAAVLLIEASDTNLDKHSGIAVIISGLLFLTSCMAQYGPLFHGPAGVSIPVGIPAVIGVGWWMYRDQGDREETSDEERMKDEITPDD